MPHAASVELVSERVEEGVEDRIRLGENWKNLREETSTSMRTWIKWEFITICGLFCILILATVLNCAISDNRDTATMLKQSPHGARHTRGQTIRQAVNKQTNKPQTLFTHVDRIFHQNKTIAHHSQLRGHDLHVLEAGVDAHEDVGAPAHQHDPQRPTGVELETNNSLVCY